MNRFQPRVLFPKPTIDFDVKNPQHVKAILDITHKGKLHPELRFNLKAPFESVPDMAVYMMNLEYVRGLTGEPIHDDLFTQYEAQTLSKTGNASFSNKKPLRTDVSPTGGVTILRLVEPSASKPRTEDTQQRMEKLRDESSLSDAQKVIQVAIDRQQVKVKSKFLSGLLRPSA